MLPAAFDTRATYRAAIWIDVYHLKLFNDRHGYAAGNEVIQGISAAIREVAGDDVTSRSGGDEFLVALPDSRHGDAAVLAERIRAAVERLGLSVTISLGVAEAADVGADFRALVDAADDRVNGAKAHGRNRVWPQHQPGEGG